MNKQDGYGVRAYTLSTIFFVVSAGGSFVGGYFVYRRFENYAAHSNSLGEYICIGAIAVVVAILAALAVCCEGKRRDAVQCREQAEVLHRDHFYAGNHS